MDKTASQHSAHDIGPTQTQATETQAPGLIGPFAGALGWQRAAGNRAVSRLLGASESVARDAAGGLARPARTQHDLARLETPAIQRAPQPGWDPGWAKESKQSGDKSGQLTKSTTEFTSGRNAGTTNIGTIKRIPLDFLSLGNQEQSMRDRDGKPVRTQQSAQGRAIVLLPATLKTDRPVDVLLHLHGMNEGYRESGGTTRDADPNLDNLEQQLQDSGRTQMIAVLPQGTTKSKFGAGAGDKQTLGFNSDAYLKEIFSTLAFMGVWLDAPKLGQVVLSAHSGGGGAIGEQMLAGKEQTSAPSRMSELILFDAINGPNEVAGVVTWVTAQLDQALATLTKTGITPDQQTKYLDTGMRFRGYHTGPAGASPSSSIQAGYENRYAVVEAAINAWFKTHAAQLGGVSSPIYSKLRDNFKIQAVGHNVHDAIVGRGNHLRDELTSLPPTTSGVSLFRQSADTATPSAGAGVPSSVYKTLNTAGETLDPATRSLMEARFSYDFSQVRLHTDAAAAESAQSIGALAYTMRRDIVFGAGQYAPGTAQGRHLLAHELSHVLQQRDAEQTADALTLRPPDDSYEREAEQYAALAAPRHAMQMLDQPAIQRQPTPARPLSARRPEDAPTYEQWLETFASLPTFVARDTTATGTHTTGFDVLGQSAAPVRDDPNAAASRRPPNPNPSIQAADHFIDRPTETWVRANLPDNLLETAYRLPSDCADIAVILRHVWLSAHHRTETYNGWVVGDRAGGPATERVRQLIVNEVGSGSVAAMLNPYSDNQGQRLRSFAALQNLLHPGDVLVWEHHRAGFGTARTGGHTQTISEIRRDASGNITAIVTLQGNQPLSVPQATEIQSTFTRGAPTTDYLRNAPGRRIERESLSRQGGDLRDITPVASNPAQHPLPIWTWADGHTTLVAAGPPQAAARPAMQTQGGVRQRRLADWLPTLRGADLQNLSGRLESALQEMRANIEGGQAVTDDEARSLGQAAGDTVWRLSQRSSDPGNRSFAPLQQMQLIEQLRAVISALGRGNAPGTAPARAATQATVRRLFALAEDTFRLAARGATSIDFARRVPAGTRVVRVLVTGFDPFNVHDSAQAPRPNDWNPSGAAVLALDHTTVPVSRGVVAAVEGIILPVNFDDFRAGLVERIIQPLATSRGVDAIITVSEDPGIAPNDPVRLEQFSVGSHLLNNGVLEAIPAAGDGGTGPAIIRTAAPLGGIASAIEQPAARGRTAIPRPNIGTQVTFEFATPGEAADARTALGLPAAIGTTVEVSDDARLQQILSTMSRVGTSTRISFQLGKKTFQATVISGPGGNFLSNEVAFRAQRLLGSSAGSPSPTSFHIHTQRGTTDAGAEVPQDAAGRRVAANVRTTLITTLQRAIKAVADRIPIP